MKVLPDDLTYEERLKARREEREMELKTSPTLVRHPWLDRVSSYIDGTDLTKVEYLTSSDNMFQFGEYPDHPLVVWGLYIFGSPMDANLLQQQIDIYAKTSDTRMTSKLNKNQWLLGRPYFELDESYNVKNHFKHVTLPSPGGQLELEKACSEAMETPLDPNHPQWFAYYITGLEDNRCAIVWGSHHSLADGSGFVRMLMKYLASLDPSTGLPDPNKKVDDAQNLTFSTGRNKVVDQVKVTKPYLDQAQDLTMAIIKGTFAFVVGILIMLWNWMMLLLVYSRKSLQTPQILSRKQFAYSSKISLNDIKFAKTVLGCTINDLMLTAVSGAIERYIRSVEDGKVDDNIVFMIPTSMRRMTDLTVSNSTSCWLLGVPTTHANVFERLQTVVTRMRLAKRSFEPEYYMRAGAWSCLFPWALPLPPFNWRRLMKVGAVFTNVAGSPTKIRWGGREEYERYIGQVCNTPTTIGTCLMSYHDHITLSVFMDLDPEGVIFGPGSSRSVVAFFEDECARLVAIARALVGTRRRKSVVEVGMKVLEAPYGEPRDKETIDEAHSDKHPLGKKGIHVTTPLKPQPNGQVEKVKLVDVAA